MGEIKVVCGALAFKEGRFVLVKEAQKVCYGKWNYPAGHLDFGEDILTAAIREVKEETNLDVTLDGLIGIYEHNKGGNNAVKFIFKASVIGGTLKFAKGELLDAKWFSFEDFSKLKDDEIRTLDLKKTIDDCKNKKLLSLDTINLDFV
jgi:ADP-ribose pyrophosphatase YjhB (NUDIX family)